MNNIFLLLCALIENDRAERLDYARVLARAYEARRYGYPVAHLVMFEIDRDAMMEG